MSQLLLYKVCRNKDVKHAAKALRPLLPFATGLLPEQRTVWQQSWLGKLLLVLLSDACIKIRSQDSSPKECAELL